MPDLVLGSTTILSDSSGTPTIQSGVDLGLTANHSGVKTAINASGDAPIYACRAWVLYDQVNDNVVGSGNISSVTDNSEGNYTLNFLTAMPDTNYAVVNGNNKTDGDSYPRHPTLNSGNTKSTTQLNMLTEQHDGTNRDEPNNSIAIFR